MSKLWKYTYKPQICTHPYSCSKEKTSKHGSPYGQHWDMQLQEEVISTLHCEKGCGPQKSRVNKSEIQGGGQEMADGT